MKNDKAWFNVGAKCNRRMKEAARNARMVLKGVGVVERGTCYIKPGAMAKVVAR